LQRSEINFDVWKTRSDLITREIIIEANHGNQNQTPSDQSIFVCFAKVADTCSTVIKSFSHLPKQKQMFLVNTSTAVYIAITKATLTHDWVDSI